MVLHPNLAVIEQIQTQLVAWLRELGLELKPSKTRITRSPQSNQGNCGFDFLGLHIRQYPVGETHTARSTHGKPLGFRTLIKPSPMVIQRHYETIRELTHGHRLALQGDLIRKLTPAIRGWANCYATVVSTEAYSHLNHPIFQKLPHWAYRRHLQKSRCWIITKYWRLDAGALALRKEPTLSSATPRRPFTDTSRCAGPRVPTMAIDCTGPVV